MLRAIARARTVLAVPGTSSKRTWPLQASAARTSLISSCLPRMTDSRFSRKREATSMAASVEPLIPPEYTRGYSRRIAIRRVGKPSFASRGTTRRGYEEAVQEVRAVGGRIRRADHARRGDGRIHRRSRPVRGGGDDDDRHDDHHRQHDRGDDDHDDDPGHDLVCGLDGL